MTAELPARTVRRQHRAVRDDIGDLLTQRPLPNPALDQIDPFLFLNHHGPQVYPPGNRGLPFGPHPHRGFETVTFIVAGSLMHADTAGHESVITAGGVQWMTAGSGVEHSELSPPEFLEHGGPLEILQLWVNLPSRLKMTAPRYIGLQREQLPVVETDGGRVSVTVISGSISGITGPVEPLTDVAITTIAFRSGGRLSMPVLRRHTLFLYVVHGTIEISETSATAFHLVELNNDGDTIVIEASSDALVVFGHASPLDEPVVAHGPFVMNTREEIVEAIHDFHAGRFRQNR